MNERPQVPVVMTIEDRVNEVVKQLPRGHVFQSSDITKQAGTTPHKIGGLLRASELVERTGISWRRV